MRYVPSLVVGVLVFAAFVLGRAMGRLRHGRLIAVVLFFPLLDFALRTLLLWFSAFIPVALVVGCWTYGHDKLAPRLFR